MTNLNINLEDIMDNKQQEFFKTISIIVYEILVAFG